MLKYGVSEMLAPDNSEIRFAPPTDPSDVTIGSLLSFLATHTEKPLLFIYDSRTIRPGYHVTEVKAGQFAALDCGANPESWTEIFVQLLDGDEDRTHMPAGKFSAIIRKVTEFLALDPGAKLTFEVSDGARPIQLYRAALPRVAGDEVQVALSPRPASCKPRDRWLEQQKSVSAACCGTAAGAEPCCRA